MKSCFSQNLTYLRLISRQTQDELAEIINVSRQTISKWENGNTIPDIVSCNQIAKLYNVSIDNLINYEMAPHDLPISTNGKHFCGVVAMDNDNQIRLPQQALEILKINGPTNFSILIDENIQPVGLALVPEKALEEFLNI